MRRILVLLMVLALGAATARAEGPAPAPTSGVAPDEEVVPNPPKKWGFAFLGAAAGCALIAIGTGAAALAKVGSQEGSVSSPPDYTRDLQSDARAGKDLAAASYAFAGIAGALAIIDAVIWYETLRKPQKIKKAAAWLGPTGVRF